MPNSPLLQSQRAGRALRAAVQARLAAAVAATAASGRRLAAAGLEPSARVKGVR
jgi:hypothetical protein